MGTRTPLTLLPLSMLHYTSERMNMLDASPTTYGCFPLAPLWRGDSGRSGILEKKTGRTFSHPLRCARQSRDLGTLIITNRNEPRPTRRQHPAQRAEISAESAGTVQKGFSKVHCFSKLGRFSLSFVQCRKCRKCRFFEKLSIAPKTRKLYSIQR